MSTYHCCEVLQQNGQEITAHYCKQRWCPVCGSIRTAKAINGYVTQFEKFSDPYFVTLTKQTVLGDDLPDSIILMEKVWRSITDRARGKGSGFMGVRKAECTLRPDGSYHYHFHILLNGRENAEWLVSEWLHRMEGMASRAAQDIRLADKRSYVELFKYATKLVATSKDGERGLLPFERLDVIFRALKGKKTYYPFGGLRAVSEEVDKLSTDEFDWLLNEEQVWVWRECDWVSQVGELLSNYVPNESFRKLFNS